MPWEKARGTSFFVVSTKRPCSLLKKLVVYIQQPNTKVEPQKRDVYIEVYQDFDRLFAENLYMVCQLSMYDDRQSCYRVV